MKLEIFNQNYGGVSILYNRAIHIQSSSGIINLPTKGVAMRKARFTEHQIIDVIKSVESGRTVKDVCREHIKLTGDYIWKSNRIPPFDKFRRQRPAKVERSKKITLTNGMDFP